MNKIEQIKAEIESRLKNYWKICFHDVKAFNEDSNVRELKELLSFLRTLESEKPVPAETSGDSEAAEAKFKIEERKWVHDIVDNTFPEQDGDFISESDYRKVLKATARHFAEWGEKNAYKAIMKKADEVRDKRFDTDYEVKFEPAAGFDLGCVNVYHEDKLVGQYVEPKEELKSYIKEKMAILEGILKEPMTVDNVETLTCGDKLAAIGGLNQLLGVMTFIDKKRTFGTDNRP